MSDGSLFSLKTVYLTEDFVSQAADTTLPVSISEDVEAELRFACVCLRAERAALSLVANAEQTIAGLERKLRERGHGEDYVRAVVEYMSDIGAVSDERYAELWLRSRLSMKADSPHKLLAALRAKGIDRATAKNALDAALDFDTELALLKKYAAKNRLESMSQRERRQKLRFEGFSADAVSTFEDELLSEESESEDDDD